MNIKSLLSSILIFSSLWTSGQSSLTLIPDVSINQHEQARLDDSKRLIKAKPIYRKPIVIDGPVSHAILKTSNGCGIGNFIIPSTGNALLGIPPVIGSLIGTGSSVQKILDTIPGTQIKGVAFQRTGWVENTSIIGTPQTLVVVSDSGMFSYEIPYDYEPWSPSIPKIGSLFIPNIIKMASQITTIKTNPIVLFVGDSTSNYQLRFFSYPGLQEQFSVSFDFEPEIFEVVDSALFVTGQDSSGNYMLYHFSALQDTLFATFTLNALVSNPHELLVSGDSLFILSSPGDSIIMLTTINRMDSSIAQTVVYQKSGARATHNEYRGDNLFTFQPISDFPDSVLDKQILILNPVTYKLDTLQINLELDVFKHPRSKGASWGNFSLIWIGAKWGNGLSDTVYLNQSWTTYKIETGAFPQYINATYGCWIGVPENELDRIEFKLYPNPASSDVTIKLSGLEKGRKYKLEIRDLFGKVHYTTSLKAYQEIQIPIETLAKGLYFIKLDTGRNIITQQLIIQ